MEQLLFLADADIAALELGPGAVRACMRATLSDYGEGLVRCEPKTSIWVGAGHAFQSLAAVDLRRGFAATKWLGMVPPAHPGAVNIRANILLSDVASGELLCLMDARRATALRTAGMSAVAAQHLAREGSTSIGFVGAGVQAEAHLLALVEAIPTLRTVRVNSRTPSTAERFAAWSRERGLDAAVMTAQEAVGQSDIVVTTVPLAPGFKPFIDAGWIRPGACVLAVDLGRPWLHQGLEKIDVTAVDEDALKHYAKPGNFIPPLGHAQATLLDLVCGRHPGRTDAGQRIMAFSSGSGVADLAIARLIYEQATARGLGTCLLA